MTRKGKMYWVDVLISQSTGKRYVGQTDDLDRRIKEHNDPDHKPRKHTSRNSGPWILVYVEMYLTRSEAMQREKWLKSGMGREWLNGKIGRACLPEVRRRRAGS